MVSIKVCELRADTLVGIHTREDGLAFHQHFNTLESAEAQCDAIEGLI